MPRRYKQGADGQPHPAFYGKLPEEFSKADTMRFMVETDLKLSGCVSADTLAALRAEGYDYKDGNLVPAGKEETMQEKVANKVAGMVDVVARIVADGEPRTFSFKSNEVIFGGGRLRVNAKDIPLDVKALFAVYDEANKNAASGVVESTTPAKTGRTGRKKAETPATPADKPQDSPKEEQPTTDTTEPESPQEAPETAAEQQPEKEAEQPAPEAATPADGAMNPPEAPAEGEEKPRRKRKARD